MQYIFALMYRSGHAEAQIIDPVSKRTRLGIDFHGAAPKAPEHFEGRGALLVPISEKSVKALEAKMAELRRDHGDGTTPKQAIEKLVAELGRLKAEFPPCSEALSHAAGRLGNMVSEARGKGETLIDCQQPVRTLLTHLADEIRPIAPDAAERIAGHSDAHSLLHRFRYANTGYYCANELTDRYKYERKDQSPLDYTGYRTHSTTDKSRHKRPRDSKPLIGTNCLHFVLQSAYHDGGIPLVDIDDRLEDSFPASVLESIVEDRMLNATQKGEGPECVKAGLYTLPNHAPIGVVYSEAKEIRFPDDIKNLTIDGKNLLESLAGTRHPLFDPSMVRGVGT